MSVKVQKRDLPNEDGFQSYADVCAEEEHIVFVQPAYLGDPTDKEARVFLGKKTLLALIAVVRETWPEWLE